jgi:uncharacterized protein (TIGR03067 family)
MRGPALLVVTASLLIAADDAKQDEVKKDMEKFQGTWKAVSIEHDGAPVSSEEELASIQLVVSGDKRTLKVADEIRSQSTYKLDPTKKPKAIDITVSEGLLQGRTLVGIYEVDGDTHKICLAVDGQERPKELASKAGSGHLLQVFRREKK